MFRDPRWRRSVEEKLERYHDLPPGSICVYCPDRKMNLKEFEMLVQSQPNGEIKKLAHILDRGWKTEMEAINQRFAPLWSLFVFVDPAALDASAINNPRVRNLSAACETLFGFPNDILELQHTGRPIREQIADRVVRDHQKRTGAAVPHDVYEELVAAPHRSEQEDLLAGMEKHLSEIMGKPST